MVQKITHGIKISVITNFEGTIYRNYRLFFGFRYQVTIENQSNETVQLLERHWRIFDSLNHTEIIEGAGVIGKKPVLKPAETHTYKSTCMITSPIGAMKGIYKMVHFSSSRLFKVYIPPFQLMLPSIYN